MIRIHLKVGELHRDIRGAVIIWVTVMMLVIVGFIGLGIDGARYLNLNSNLQEIADGAALAGANQLDGSADAITRATDKAINYIQTQPQWADVAASGVQIASDSTYGPKFYYKDGTGNFVPTTDPSKASYIKVNTIMRQVSLTFGVVSNTVANLQTSATAMAQSSYSVCAPLQSFMCNPWESEETVKGSASNWKSKVTAGQMLMLVGGSKGAPGNWGFIQAPAKNGNPHNFAAFWSDPYPSNCPSVDISAVSQQVDTGNNGSFAVQGMNVRFDNPVNQLNSFAGPIVIDGFKPNTNNQNQNGCANSTDAKPPGFTQTDTNASNYDTLCGAATPLGSCPLPRDRVMTNLGGNAWSTSMKGSGADLNDLAAYWTNHHYNSLSTQVFHNADGTTSPVTNRWQIYQMENDTTTYPDARFTGQSDVRENSTPFCRDSKPAGDLSRRKINVAIVDCDYWKITGASNDLPVTTLMAEFFMTEPATASGAIYAELIKTYEVNADGSNIFHLVQLVR